MLSLLSRSRRYCAASAFIVAFSLAVPSAAESLVSVGANGKLVYKPDARGNGIPDYSYAGYKMSEAPLPEAAVRITLKPAGGGKDDSAAIQAALDEVGRMPLAADGTRGAVLLTKGTYALLKPLTISVSGVVLRGEGDGADGTVLKAVMREKCKLITIMGEGKREEVKGSRCEVADERVPVGAKSFSVDSVRTLKVGDSVMVMRNTNQEWVAAVGMDKIPGRPSDPKSTKQWPVGPREGYDRKIVAIEGNRITLDAPIYNDLTKKYGGGFVYVYEFPGRIENCGVENLRAESVWVKGTGPKDREGNATLDDLKHAEHFVVIDNAQNCWVKNTACLDFLQGGVWVERNGRSVTLQDCYYEVADPKLNNYMDEPHGETSRYSFCFIGQGNLAVRCTGRFGRHTFMTQSMAAGPNVFLDCDAITDHGPAETHHRWATGVLFDRVGQKHPSHIMSANRAWMGSGHGWSGAYVTFWNCVGDPIIIENPPTASNWAIGCSGTQKKGPFGPIDESAYHDFGKPAAIESLYRAQLRDRLGADALQRLQLAETR